MLIEPPEVILVRLVREEDGLDLREIRSQSVPQTNERHLRGDLAIFKDRVSNAAVGRGRSASWKHL